MAVLYITELDTLGTPTEGGSAPIAHLPPIAEQTLAIAGSSGQSSAFNTATRFILVETDAVCAIAVGPNPTAQTSSGTATGASAIGTARLAAGDREYFAVTGGHKIAVISTT